MYQNHVASIKLNSKWKLIFYPIIAAIMVLVVLSGFFDWAFSLILPLNEEINTSPASAASMVATVLIGGLLMCKMSKITFSDLGWHKKGAVKESFLGALGGFLAITTVFLLIFVLGGLKLTHVFTIQAIPGIISAFVFYLFQGTWEELVVRSYMMPHFSKVFGDKWSMVITSVLFAALHGANPNIEFLPLVNLFIFGMVFAAIYYRTGSLWIVGVAHSFWNFIMGHFYGAEVSGTMVKDSIFLSIPQAGKNLISGGSFGYEGGSVTTIVGVLIIVYFLVVFRDKPHSI